MPAVVGELLAAGLLPYADAITAIGTTMAKNCAHRRSDDLKVIRPASDPLRTQAGFINLTGNLFDSAIMKTSVISPAFRAKYLSTPGDPNVSEAREVVFDGPEHFHRGIDDPAENIDEDCILFMRGAGPNGYPGGAQVVNMRRPAYLLKQGVEALPCVGRIGKFMSIGLNYKDRAIETGNPFPDCPVLFMKATLAIVGPNDDVSMPRGSTSVDWKLELSAAIGKRAKSVSKADALDHVAGHCIVNDVNERHVQNKLSGNWTTGRPCDTFGPTSPWRVTRDDIEGIQNLSNWLDVNGKRMQTGNTKKMIFTVEDIIEHLFDLMTLHPGNVNSPGTPPGVGMGMTPQPVYRKTGDVMELWIEGLGQQRQVVKQDA